MQLLQIYAYHCNSIPLFKYTDIKSAGSAIIIACPATLGSAKPFSLSGTRLLNLQIQSCQEQSAINAVYVRRDASLRFGFTSWMGLVFMSNSLKNADFLHFFA